MLLSTATPEVLYTLRALVTMVVVASNKTIASARLTELAYFAMTRGVFAVVMRDVILSAEATLRKGVPFFSSEA